MGRISFSLGLKLWASTNSLPSGPYLRMLRPCDESTLVLIKTMRRRFIILICVSWWKKSSSEFFYFLRMRVPLKNDKLSFERINNCEVACDRCWRRKFSIKTRHFGVRNRSINQTFLAHSSKWLSWKFLWIWPAFFLNWSQILLRM